MNIDSMSPTLERTFSRLTNDTKWKRDLKKYTANTVGVMIALTNENIKAE